MKVATNTVHWMWGTYFDWYAFVWFHIEALWIKDPERRRPFTFIMRDWIFPHKNAFIAMLIIWYIGIGVWAWFEPSRSIILVILALGIFSGWLSAHLVWGGKWINGEQEWPPVIEI